MYTIYVNGELVYNPAQQDTRPIITPKLSQEVNQAGDLQFVILPGHPLYDSLTPIDSYVTAYDDGEEVFYGRVLTPETPMLSGERQIHCEGALSFLLDAEMPPDPKQDIVEEDVDGNEHVVGTEFVHETMTAEEFFERCINTFNAQIDNDSRRVFHVGNVTHSKKNESREYQITSYQQIRSAIDTQLIEYYGGFIQARRGGDGLLYLDWLEGASRINPQPVAIGENVISQNNRISGENIFTHLRPIGKDGLTLPEDTLVVMPNTNYGKIIRSVTFGLAEDENELRSQAQEYINKIEKMLLADADINLLDLHFIDGNVSKIRLGDGFTNLRGFEGELMTVATVERDFEQPQNDSITVKNAKGFESVRAPDGSDRNRVTSIGQVGTATSGGVTNSLSRSYGGSHSGLYKYIHESENQLELNTEKIAIHALDLFETANNFLRLSHQQDSTQLRVGEIEGTAVIQNSARIAAVAGKFTIVHNDQTGIDDLYLQDGTELDISDQNGARISVGTAIRTTNGIVENHRQRIDTIQGSALWTQKDHIVAVSGEYEIESLSTGAKRLIIKSGGGLNIRKDGVELGVYLTDDTGNTKLDGGLIVQKINGHSETHITGDKVVIGSEGTSSLSSWVTAEEGKIALKVSKGDVMTQLAVEAGNVTVSGGNLVVDGYVTATGLGAAIGDLDTLVAKSIIISNGGTLSTTGYVACSELKTTTLTLGGHAVTSCLVSASVSQDRLTLTLTDSAGGTTTFSKATTLMGGWSSGRFTVTADPQGSTYYTDLKAGAVSWDGNTATVPINAYDNGQTQYERPTDVSVTVDASGRYSAGRTQGRTDYTGKDIEVTSQKQGQTWYVTITRNDDSTQMLEIDMSSVYTKARSGYTYGTFRLATVTLQGEGVYIQEIGSPVYFQSTSVTPISGSGYTVTRKQRNLRKSTGITALTGYTNYNGNNGFTLYYYDSSSKTYKSAGYHVWRYGGTTQTLYESDGYDTFYDVGSGAAGKTLYDAGSSETLYEKKSSGGSGISTYYNAKSGADYYKKGSTVTDQYYTKS